MMATVAKRGANAVARANPHTAKRAKISVALTRSATEEMLVVSEEGEVYTVGVPMNIREQYVSTVVGYSEKHIGRLNYEVMSRRVGGVMYDFFGCMYSQSGIAANPMFPERVFGKAIIRRRLPSNLAIDGVEKFTVIEAFKGVVETEHPFFPRPGAEKTAQDDDDLASVETWILLTGENEDNDDEDEEE